MQDYGSDEKIANFKFKVNGEEYEGIGEAPGGLFTMLAEMADAASNVEKIKVVDNFFSAVLAPASYTKWNDRFTGKTKGKRPISLPRALEVFEGMIDHYTEDIRPTEAT